MALSNWDTMSMDEKGKTLSGEFVSPLGVKVEFYKNWIYVRESGGCCSRAPAQT